MVYSLQVLLNMYAFFSVVLYQGIGVVHSLAILFPRGLSDSSISHQLPQVDD
jgi:hypothetical protein